MPPASPAASSARRRRERPQVPQLPADALFDKGRTLYLIDRAKAAIRRTGRVVLVEGNTDALMAHQAGFDNVVCSMGTALTAGQVELLTRYAPRIALAYDVDAAGQSAATFGATELTALVGEIERSPYRGRLTDVDVVRLPDGRDPDEVIRDDPDAWRAATESPQPIMEFLIDRAASRHDQRTVPGRERLVAAVLPTLRTIADPVRRDGYIQLLARRSGVDERTLLEALRRPEAAGTSAGAARAGPGGQPHQPRGRHGPARRARPAGRGARHRARRGDPAAPRPPLPQPLRRPQPPGSGGETLRDHPGARALEGPRRRPSRLTRRRRAPSVSTARPSSRASSPRWPPSRGPCSRGPTRCPTATPPPPRPSTRAC